MHVDERHLLAADPGDGVQVTYELRDHDYGPMLGPGGNPLLGVNHVFGMYSPDTMDPTKDGTVGVAKRVQAGSRYYAHLQVARNGNVWLGVPFNRCAIHCEHSWNDPVSGKRYEINRVAIGSEKAGCGWIRANGQMPGHSGVDLTRPDIVKIGHLYWQIETPEQQHTDTLIWQAVRDRYGMPAENLIHGHGELAHGGHELCPGPLILEALHNIILPALLGQEPPVVPYEAAPFSGEPSICEVPEDVFAEHGGTLEDPDLGRYFSADEIERYVRCGALTHDDEELQASTMGWHWNPAALAEAEGAYG